jgi:hypothetical protein
VQQPKQVAKEGLQRWQNNLRADFMTAFMFWFPMHSINFRLVPLNYRLPFMAAIGCGWVAILSTRSGNRPREIVAVE